MRRTPRQVLRSAAVLAVLAPLGCGAESPNVGVHPAVDAMYFPAGLLVDPDPARAVDGRPRWLFVANGNSDLSFNAGSLLAIDLERFWNAWFDPVSGSTYPYCDEIGGPSDVDRCVLPPATPVTDERPCRRLALSPTVVECDEAPFVRDSQTVTFGDFGTAIAASQETGNSDDFTRLWIPVRGDPSITWIDVRGAGDDLELECGQGDDPLDDRLCDDAHRLEHLRNDDDLRPLSREPFNIIVSDVPGHRDRFAFVAHADGSDLTVVAIDGVLGDGRPTIVDQPPVFRDQNGNGAGGYGIAQRPCFGAGQGPLGDADPEPSVPAVTEDCTRPLIYASFRYVQNITSFTASGVRPPQTAPVIAQAERDDCFADLPVRCDGDVAGCDAQAGACEVEACERVYAGQYCATPEQIGQPCAVLCDPQVRARRVIQPGGLLGDTGLALPRLGDLAFGDTRGDELWIVQTNPGALLKLDTSLDDDGVPRDLASAPPIEICAEPTRMKLYNDEGQRFAFITCFAAAVVFVVDLDAGRVVDNIVVGTGPHELVVDEGRRALYVANTLEASVSVIDLARERLTRFREIARIGLQEPFSQ